MIQIENFKRGIGRTALLVAGFAVMAFGIAFSTKAGLGTTPTSSVPYVFSLFTPLTIGQGTILMHAVFVGLQILVLRRLYQPLQLMQLPVAFLFGYFVDLAVWAIQDVTVIYYWQQWAACAIGIVLLAIGITLMVKADLFPEAMTGFILALTQVTSVKFSTMKIIMDLSLVGISCLIALVFLSSLEGVREGTIAAAIFVGLLTRLFNKLLQPADEKMSAAENYAAG